MHRGGSQTQSIGIDSTGILDIGETEQLSIAERALMRKYKSLETVLENLQQAGTYKQEITSGVSRVDGHLLKPSLSLLLLLLCTALRVRRREKGSFGKGNPKKANTGADVRDEHNRDLAGSPCGFQSKVAEPPVPPACFSSP